MTIPGWIIDSLHRFRPELALVAAILGVLIAELFPRLRRGPVAALAVLGVVTALAILLRDRASIRSAAPEAIFSGSYAVDGYSVFFKGLFLLAAVVTLLFSRPSVNRWKSGQGEFHVLVLSCVTGMCLMAGSNDLLMMYLSLEFVSVTSYLLSGLLRRSRRSAEASLKYILYGAAASGLMIYGMSFLYGVTGTLNLQELGARIGSVTPAPKPFFFLVPGILVLAGFAYKIAAVPFHMWCPDVYEGAPTAVTAFFSVGPKAAGFAMLGRFLFSVFGASGGHVFPVTQVLAVMCLVTMLTGNLAALQQQNLKRMLAYSSIGHAGYILMAFTTISTAYLSTALFYLAAYVVMNLGAFLVVLALEEQYGVETVEGCRGLGWRVPVPCVLMAFFLFSLTGLPPTAGFWGKFYIFSELVRQGGTLPLVLVGGAILCTVLSLYYYARILAAMFLVKPKDEARLAPVHPVFSLLLWILAAGTLGLGLLPQSLLGLAREGATHLLGAR